MPDSCPESVWILLDLNSFTGSEVKSHAPNSNRQTGFYSLSLSDLSSPKLLFSSSNQDLPVKLVFVCCQPACANLRVLSVSSSAFPSLQEPVSTPAIYEEPFADLKVKSLYLCCSYIAHLVLPTLPELLAC